MRNSEYREPPKEQLVKYTYEIWDDFLNFGEKWGDKVSTPFFAGCVLRFVSKMCFDTAPSKEAVKKLVEDSMKEGYEWHISEKQKD